MFLLHSEFSGAGHEADWHEQRLITATQQTVSSFLWRSLINATHVIYQFASFISLTSCALYMHLRCETTRTLLSQTDRASAPHTIHNPVTLKSRLRSLETGTIE